MKFDHPKDRPCDDLFRARLDPMINLGHEWVALADRIDWAHLDDQLAGVYTQAGHPSIPSRLKVGLPRLKSMYALSDEGVCARWVENPYDLYFCGETFFQPSSQA